MSWYYAQSDESKGPIPEAEFLQLIAQGVIQPTTLVWREGMDRWEPWADLQPRFVSGGAAPASASADPIAGNPVPPQAGQSTCVACLKPFAEEDLIVLAGRKVCAACKPTYVQKLQEGAMGWSAPGEAAGSSGGAHGNLSSEEVLARDYDVPAVELVTAAGRRIQQDPGTLLVAGILALVALWGVQLVTVPFQLIPILGMLFGMVLPAILMGPILAGLALTYLRHLRGMQVSAGDVFCGFGPRFWKLAMGYFVPTMFSSLVFIPAVVLMVVLGVTVGGAFGPGGTPNFGPGAGGGPTGTNAVVLGVAMGSAFLIAGIVYTYLTVCWMYTLSLVADRHYGIRDAMKLSRAMVMKHFWQHLWFIVFAGLVMMLGFMVCCVGVLIAMPIVGLAGTMLYERLFHGLASRAPQ